MNLKEQRYICTLAELGSITKAAEQLYISQSALSSYLGNVENQLGAKLFYRSGKGFFLTYAGECYVKKARVMLEMKHQFDDELKEIVGGRKGLVRLGIQSRRSAYLIPKTLRMMAEEYPEVTVNVFEHNNNELEDLYQRHKLDLVVQNSINAVVDTEYELLCREKLLLAVPYNSPVLTKGKPLEGCPFPWIDLRHLDGATFILPTPKQSLRAAGDEIMQSDGVKPGRIITISSIETAMYMVSEGLGVAFNREFYARHMQCPRPLVYFVVGEPVREGALYAVYRKDSYMPGYMRRLIEIIKELVNH